MTIYKSSGNEALLKRSIIYYYLSPLTIDLSYQKVLYKSVLLSNKKVTLRKLTSPIYT